MARINPFYPNSNRLLVVVSVSIFLFFSGAGSPPPVKAEGGAETGAGQILLHAKGRSIPALHLESQLQFDVSGVLADVTLKQTFINQSDLWHNATYVLPLPETAAVYAMTMRVGERVIRAVVQEKQQARKTFEKARNEGRKAALTEQLRANLFRQQVANIGPGEQIMVEIKLLQQADYDQGSFSLRFPMTLTPRFVPGRPQSEVVITPDRHGWAAPTDQVSDAHLLSPHMQTANGRVINPVVISAKLNVGMELREIASAYHQIRVMRHDAQYDIGLVDGPVSMDRDFVLTWSPVVGTAPRAAVFREQLDGTDYVMLMVVPPERDHAIRALPRDMVMVIDTSGSMDGTSIVQARAGLQQALQRLRPEDRFNLLAFNDATTSLFTNVVPADAVNLQAASQWTAGLDAGGGTMMEPAIQAALRPDSDGDGYLKHVIFITDGAVANEDTLFSQLAQTLGDTRFFPVGIGSAPNSYFMRRAARLGRGTHTHIGDIDEVQAQMSELFDKIDRPVASDIEIHWPGQVDVYPRRTPSVYQCEPLIVVARADSLEGQVRITGVAADAPFEQVISLDLEQQSTGTAKYWARQKIQDLVDEGVMTGQLDQLKDEIIEVALAHSLVSRFTSLVAVEEVVSRPPAEQAREAVVRNAMAHGQRMQVRYPQTATRARQSLLIGLSLLVITVGLWFVRVRRAARGLT